jgi:hypothetical protein
VDEKLRDWSRCKTMRVRTRKHRGREWIFLLHKDSCEIRRRGTEDCEQSNQQIRVGAEMRYGFALAQQENAGFGQKQCR